jgi:hypothetical protein
MLAMIIYMLDSNWPELQSNSFHFVKHPDDFFSQQQIANEVRGENLEGERGVFMAFGRRISASPDQRVRSLIVQQPIF